jgi:hypothetical protein
MRPKWKKTYQGPTKSALPATMQHEQCDSNNISHKKQTTKYEQEYTTKMDISLHASITLLDEGSSRGELCAVQKTISPVHWLSKWSPEEPVW